MKFEEWLKKEEAEFEVSDASEHTKIQYRNAAEDGWNACLEHNRIGFIEREIEVIKKQLSAPGMPTFNELDITIRLERLRENAPFYRLSAIAAALEYLKEKTEKDKE